jgi:Mg2+-importing ATPase
LKRTAITCSFSDQGRRVLGIAYREFGPGQRIEREDESGMVFLGFVVLSDPPKAGVVRTIREPGQLGVRLKIITGDNTLIAAHVAREVGLDNVRILLQL